VGNHEEKSNFWNLWTNFVPFFASFNFFFGILICGFGLDFSIFELLG